MAGRQRDRQIHKSPEKVNTKKAELTIVPTLL